MKKKKRLSTKSRLAQNNQAQNNRDFNDFKGDFIADPYSAVAELLVYKINLVNIEPIAALLHCTLSLYLAPERAANGISYVYEKKSRISNFTHTHSVATYDQRPL